MKTSLEIKVLQLFEQALAMPPEDRGRWLAGQELDAGTMGRVLRLLDAEKQAEGFMEQTAVRAEEVPPEFPKVGERLGSYELLKPLEAGGMGVVYLGRRADDVYDQQVAIKLIRPVHLLAAADFRRQLISRFEDERSILARMSHPNVARILDGGSTPGGIPYLVMEYVDGVSLTDYCKANKLDVNARLALFCKVCDGVQEAHRHLIVHRDLKPDNVLVGENGEPRLLDFGIAKILEQEPMGGRDGTSLSAMTPAYASPEQVRQEKLTTSSDVYSLGVVLYQLLAGVRPYELGGLRPAEAEHVVCDTLPDPMRKMLDKAAITDAERKLRRAQLTPDVERIVAKAMHKESARRYGSAQELADDIRRYLAGEPVQAHPDSSLYRVRKFVGRHGLGVTAAGVALAAILVASGVAVWQAREARQSASDMAEVNKFLLDVLKYSDPYSSGGELSLAEAVDLGVKAIDRRFAGRPELSAPLRHTLGYSMVSRDSLELADQQLTMALAEATDAYGPDAKLTLDVREAIAQLRIAQGRTDEAESLLQALLSDIESGTHAETSMHGLVLNNLGKLYMDGEKYAQAKRLFDRAAQLPPPAPGTATADYEAMLVANQAYAAHGLGELEQAERLYRQSIGMLEALGPGHSLQMAIGMNNLAYLLSETGDEAGSYALLKQSLALRESAFGGDHPMLVGVMAGVAQKAWAQGDKEQSLALAERADAMARRVFPEPHRTALLARFTHAVALQRSDRYPEAGEILLLAEAELAALPDPPADLVEVIPKLRARLCDPPRQPLVPGCAGAGTTAGAPR
jgi:serine/threonine-protein kinase